ncbi:MAG TPA: Holliday junction ATP-dependent DNA helicase RuvA [Candidatus Omnitrophota bacterium]|nr:Holliday junction ATP-dependent DNA helicase RuvA [Candidatus Omnitrophota bacterium]
MIARICGKVIEKGNNYLLVEVSGITYEVFIPTTVMQRLEENFPADGMVALKTYHYHQVEPSRSTPILIGFMNDIEKEFFQTFITVSGIGPRAALKALNKPISQIAKAIDEADAGFLKSLPGIGQQRAREIIAKLQNKVGKFGLMQDVSIQKEEIPVSDIEEEALAVLMQLEYKKPEAQAMIKKALQRQGGILSTEGLLNEVYKQRKTGHDI